ncbi:MAG: tRNA dihydrouridine(20/20a) synthase DusA [Hyphomicrobiales bacterium]|nr:tRNA dihydrouridine(20/20a) synthase DusA [Hyphomicrobiales bacterium]
MSALPRDDRWRFCVAPMMDWTDRHCRAFHRVLTRRARLYTEMVTTGALIHGPRARLLRFDPAAEAPVALQLGGADPAALTACARMGEDESYDEINLNCGCPSDRVQDGDFGACLMRDPARVAEGVAAMKAAVRVPVTVKCRIGVDEQEPCDALFAFAQAVRGAGADALVVHARKAWLKGLSPRQNRDVPPLDRPLVRDLKRAHPDWPIVVNGGLASMDEAKAELVHVDGVMLGRAAWHDPALLLRVDPEIFGATAPVADEFVAVAAYRDHVARELADGARFADLTRCLLGLFAGRPGARAWRQALSVDLRGAGVERLDAALAHVETPARGALEAAS